MSSCLVQGAGCIGQAVVLQHALRVPQQAHVHAGAQIHAGDDQVYEDVVRRGIALGYGARLQHNKTTFWQQGASNNWRGPCSQAAAPEGGVWVAEEQGQSDVALAKGAKQCGLGWAMRLGSSTAGTGSGAGA